MEASLKNPLVDILGHPFGMSIKRFGIKPPNEMFDSIIKLCKENDKIFEINSKYHEDPKTLLKKCLKN